MPQIEAPVESITAAALLQRLKHEILESGGESKDVAFFARLAGVRVHHARYGAASG